MRIVACVKRVPVTETQPKIAVDGKRVDPGGVEFMMSFYDELAVEEAIRLKEKLGGAPETIALSLGPPEVQKELRECLAKGVDRAVILSDKDWGARDARATAVALASKIRELGAELALFGRVATDRDNAAVGPMVATLLGWACVTDVVELALDGQRGSAKRESEAGIESYSFQLPAVITCQKGLNEPRYAGLKGIMAAKKKPLEEAPAEVVANQVETLALALPPGRKEGRILGEGPGVVPALLESLRRDGVL
jgi:electron transfer flavoprotein beta subunit